MAQLTLPNRYILLRRNADDDIIESTVGAGLGDVTLGYQCWNRSTPFDPVTGLPLDVVLEAPNDPNGLPADEVGKTWYFPAGSWRVTVAGTLTWSGNGNAQIRVVDENGTKAGPIVIRSNDGPDLDIQFDVTLTAPHYYQAQITGANKLARIADFMVLMEPI